MTESTIPVLPVTHPAGGGYGPFAGVSYANDCYGYNAKDASFNAALFDQTAHRDNLKAVIEAKFDNERAFKEVQVNQERLERENQRMLAGIEATIKADGDRTRDMFMAQQQQAQSQALADIKLELALLKNGNGS